MFKALPLLRILDETPARDFRVGFPGMQLDREQRFEPRAPVLPAGVPGRARAAPERAFRRLHARGEGVHLTDARDALFTDSTANGCRHSRPTIETAPRGDRVFEVIDPFANRLLSNGPAAR